MSRPDQQQSVIEFANRHFEQFVAWGGQLLARETVAVVTGPGSGNVFWSTDGQSLAGHYIGTVRRDTNEEERFKRFGFTESEQGEGIWVVKPSRYDAEHEEISVGREHAFVHWNGMNWKIVRSNDDPPSCGEVRGWSAPSSDLSESEQGAIKRVVEESEVMLDAALTLGEDSWPYYKLGKELMQRAASGQEQDSISILIQPRQHCDLSYHLESSVYHLGRTGPALHRAFSGAGVKNSYELSILNPVAADHSVINPADFRLVEGTLLPPFPQEWSIFGISRPAVA